MTNTHRVSSVRRWLAGVSLTAVLAVVSACHGSVSDSLLVATDPDLINPGDLNSSDGATALRFGALQRLRSITGGTGGEGSTWLATGLIADEWVTSSTFIQNDEEDERKASIDNGTITGMNRTLYQARTASNQAIAAMNKYLPTQTANIAELYFVRGFAEYQLASDFCNGIPLSDGASDAQTLGSPLTDDQVFIVAIASLDTAINMTSALTDAFSISVNRAAKIAKARSLMNRNDYAGAAALVAGIPTSYSYDITYATSSGDNTLWAQPFSSQRYSVGDTTVVSAAGRTPVKPSIPFASAKDPRLPVTTTNGKSQDGSVISWRTSLWGQSTAVAAVSGIDARMIEAENFLKNGDVTNWLKTHNDMRTTAGTKIGTVTLPAMTALTDPGTAAGRIDLHFYEKAFWTFGRGQRLSDVRRLIRQYGRDQATLLPQGQHYRGLPYGTDVNLITPQAETANPNFKSCTDRKA